MTVTVAASALAAVDGQTPFALHIGTQSLLPKHTHTIKHAPVTVTVAASALAAVDGPTPLALRVELQPPASSSVSGPHNLPPATQLKKLW